MSNCARSRPATCLLIKAVPTFPVPRQPGLKGAKDLVAVIERGKAAHTPVDPILVGQ